VDSTGAPMVRPLPRCADSRLTQQGPNGPLPIIAQNGMTSRKPTCGRSSLNPTSRFSPS